MIHLARPIPLAIRPRVSVVIPCYNYGRFLADAVHSVTAQQFGVDVDVLIVDDASTDDSVQIARSLVEHDPRVRLLAHDENAGHLRTYNDGLRAVDGEYVVLLSADDMLAPDSLSRATALLESRRNIGFVYGWAQPFVNTPIRSSAEVRSWSIWNGQDWLGKRAKDLRNVVLSPEVVIRRQALEDADFFDLSLPHSADMHLWMKIAQKADIGRVNGPAQAYYREHGANMHFTDYAGALVDLQERARTWRRFSTEAAPDPCTGRDLTAISAAAINREVAAFVATTEARAELSDVQLRELAALTSECRAASAPALWTRTFERIFTAGPPVVRRAVHTFRREVRDRIRWRLWRRYGA